MNYLMKLVNMDHFPIEIKHVNSLNFKGLQIADLISWSSFQAVENKNDEYINILQNKLVKIICED